MHKIAQSLLLLSCLSFSLNSSAQVALPAWGMVLGQDADFGGEITRLEEIPKTKGSTFRVQYRPLICTYTKVNNAKCSYKYVSPEHSYLITDEHNGVDCSYASYTELQITSKVRIFDSQEEYHRWFVTQWVKVVNIRDTYYRFTAGRFNDVSCVNLK